MTSKPADSSLQKKRRRHIRIVFSDAMMLCGREESGKLVGITAAMPEGNRTEPAFGKKFPDRFFDVGIAEEHAVTFAAGLALGGMIPVVAIYSSFLAERQWIRSLHDVCMQNLHVIFAIDRAGLCRSGRRNTSGML